MKLRTNLMFISLSFLFGCSNESIRFQSTCFNNEPNPNKVGVWMYQAGNWHEGRKGSSAWLALGYKAGTRTYPSEELLYCFYVYGDNVDDISSCKSGELNILEVTDIEIKGNYNLKLENELELKGIFTASYCAPE
jgi:hypothetical protein